MCSLYIIPVCICAIGALLGGLLANYWKRKTGEAAFAACSDDGYKAFLGKEQRAFNHSVYQFKEGEIHGIEFFKTCMAALQLEKKAYHIMFMPCSNWIKYGQRFKRLDWYIGNHRPDLTSGLNDVDVFDARDSLHEAKGHGNRILERNYRITGNIKGKEIVIVDDVLTTGQSMADYKKEIERCGGKVIAAIFYGKTITLPHPFVIKAKVLKSCIAHIYRNKFCRKIS